MPKRELIAPKGDKRYVAPKTEFGHPDLRGVWNFSSNTPLERPARFKDREFMTKEEYADMQAQVRARSAQEDNTSTSSRTGVGGYNQFWVESSDQGANLRTSLLKPLLGSGDRSAIVKHERIRQLVRRNLAFVII